MLAGEMKKYKANNLNIKEIGLIIMVDWENYKDFLKEVLKFLIFLVFSKTKC